MGKSTARVHAATGTATEEGGEVGRVAKTVQRVRRETRSRPATGHYDFKQHAVDWADL